MKKNSRKAITAGVSVICYGFAIAGVVLHTQQNGALPADERDDAFAILTATSSGKSVAQNLITGETIYTIDPAIDEWMEAPTDVSSGSSIKLA